MYDELIERLRYLAKVYSICENENTQEYKLAVQAADAIEDLIMALTASNEVIAKNKPKWIPVTERLPEDDVRVLTCDGNGNIHIFSHYHGFAFPFGIRPTDPRYYMVKWWMPLPQPPEKEDIFYPNECEKEDGEA